MVWLDFGRHRFVDAKFRFSLQQLLSHTPDAACFTTPLDPRLSPSVGETVPIAGFIFLLHRCGSTLLAKALARSADNLVISEPTALTEGLWGALTGGWREPIDPDVAVPRIRALITGLTRRRTDEPRRAFVKFFTFHTLYLDLLRAAFPDVPFLFMYRDPVEVLVSAIKRPAAQLVRVKGTPAGDSWAGLGDGGTAELSDAEYLVALYSNYLLALRRHRSPVSLLNYQDMRAETLGPILEHAFGVTPPPPSLQRMQEQFRFNSKVDGEDVVFKPDGETKRRGASPELIAAAGRQLVPLVAELDRSAANLGPRLRGGGEPT